MAQKPKRPSRPYPPKGLGEWSDSAPAWYAPALDMPDWVVATFLMEDAPLYNEEHKHLLEVPIGFLWAAEDNVRRGRAILGQCEQVSFRCGRWQKGRQEQQMIQWFGIVPPFLITLDAAYACECSDAEFCALVEHELYHIGQKHMCGEPVFNKDTGQPVLEMRAHDVEEFIGVVRRYGASGEVARLVEAASKAPDASKINIARACGTCMVRAA